MEHRNVARTPGGDRDGRPARQRPVGEERGTGMEHRAVAGEGRHGWIAVDEPRQTGRLLYITFPLYCDVNFSLVRF